MIINIINLLSNYLFGYFGTFIEEHVKINKQLL